MGSLVVKIDRSTAESLKTSFHYSDIDMFSQKAAADGDLPIVYDVQAVKQSIRNILMWRVGENVVRPGFGHNIHRSMYEQLDQFVEDKIGQEIKRAIEDNEPRVNIISVAAQKDEQDEINHTLHIQVVYEVKGDKTENTQFIESAIISGK